MCFKTPGNASCAPPTGLLGPSVGLKLDQCQSVRAAISIDVPFWFLLVPFVVAILFWGSLILQQALVFPRVKPLAISKKQTWSPLESLGGKCRSSWTVRVRRPTANGLSLAMCTPVPNGGSGIPASCHATFGRLNTSLLTCG